jgi:ureidoacrylate peracid hydrolase
VTVLHPSAEIPQGLVDKIVARRGRLHVHETLDPRRTALVVIDLDEGSCLDVDDAEDVLGLIERSR